jgi:glycosyl hydrolase family 39 (putative alpha-L-iduronidase)
MNSAPKWRIVAALTVGFFAALSAAAQDAPAKQDAPVKLDVHWDKLVRVSQTSATLQVVVNPPLRRGTPLHDNAFQALRDLGADYVRYVPWLPYPKLGVAELEPPRDGKTSWDFSLIDPITIDFLEATKGHSVILNFSTIPEWMYKTDKPVAYPADANQVSWDYEQGAELRDASMKEVADYYARLYSWYTQGGFTDEFGKRHESGYHYAIPYWEVLNEVDYEHSMTPEIYTRLYDEIVTAMKAVDPKLEFVGMALASEDNPKFFEYFLDHKNHKPGVPLDFISYHFYATPTSDQNLSVEQFTYFNQADGFLKSVRYIEAIRKRLSAETKTTIDEIGVIDADDQSQGDPGHVTQPIPPAYWNLAGAMYAYVFGELATMGIEVAGESQLVGYPTQFPSVSMVDWNDGKPNPRFRVLQLLHDSFGPGDKIVAGEDVPSNLYLLAFLTRSGKKRALIINKRDRAASISIAGASGGEVRFVDQSTGFGSPGAARLASDELKLGGFSVSVVTLP